MSYNASSSVVQLVALTKNFIAAATGIPGKRKREDEPSTTKSSILGSESETERASKRVSCSCHLKEMLEAGSLEALEASRALLSETRKLAGARNERLRLRTVTRIVNIQVHRILIGTKIAASADSPVTDTSIIPATSFSKSPQPPRRSSRVANHHRHHEGHHGTK